MDRSTGRKYNLPNLSLFLQKKKYIPSRWASEFGIPSVSYVTHQRRPARGILLLCTATESIYCNLFKAHLISCKPLSVWSFLLLSLFFFSRSLQIIQMRYFDLIHCLGSDVARPTSPVQITGILQGLQIHWQATSAAPLSLTLWWVMSGGAWHKHKRDCCFFVLL